MLRWVRLPRSVLPRKGLLIDPDWYRGDCLMLHTPRLGAVVLYDNGWNHDKQGRPHVVVAICPTRGIRLCPLSSTAHGRRVEPPIPPRAGGLRYPSWVCATDAFHTSSQLFWADPTHLGRTVCHLTAGELDAVKVTALTQLQRRKSKVRTTV